MDRYAFPGEDADVYRHIVESALDYAIFTTDLNGTVAT
ncbi:hypothetical protein HNR29_006518 [Rhizobium leguminosarum]|nr:hypothetical protein [Rhizobium leguminosarum]